MEFLSRSIKTCAKREPPTVTGDYEIRILDSGSKCGLPTGEEQQGLLTERPAENRSSRPALATAVIWKDHSLLAGIGARNEENRRCPLTTL